MEQGLRIAATAGAALMGAGLIVSHVAPPTPNVQSLAVRLTSGGAAPDVPDPTIGLVMGGTTVPLPGPYYVDAANALYIAPNFPDTTYPGALANGVFTPEEFYPITGAHSSLLNYPSGADGFPAQITSEGAGLSNLDSYIQANLAAGDATTVFGYSQSTDIASLEMEKLDPSGTPSDLPVQFVLVGDTDNPNGGFFERFDGLTLPSLGIHMSGATPADDFPTDIYTIEYDGAGDYPQYPLNFLADLNATMGFLSPTGAVTLHDSYLSLTPEQIDTAVKLSTSGATETNYYMILTENLPLLDPLRAVPIVGNPIADLLQPDLKVIVNLGYGDPDFGYSTGPANVPTPMGLIPPLSDLEKVPALLLQGTEQGVRNFIGDLTGTGPNPVDLSSLSTLLDPSTAPSEAPSLSDIINGFSTDLSNAYGTLTTLADTVNALVSGLSTYDASLFADQLSDPLHAIGLPIAANIGVFTLIDAIEYYSVAESFGLVPAF